MINYNTEYCFLAANWACIYSIPFLALQCVQIITTNSRGRSVRGISRRCAGMLNSGGARHGEPRLLDAIAQTSASAVLSSSSGGRTSRRASRQSFEAAMKKPPPLRTKRPPDSRAIVLPPRTLSALCPLWTLSQV